MLTLGYRPVGVGLSDGSFQDSSAMMVGLCGFNVIALPNSYQFTFQVLVSFDLFLCFILPPGVERAGYVNDLAYSFIFVVDDKIWPIVL